MQTSTNINFPNTGSAGSIHTTGTSTSLLETWSYPERVEVNEVGESIEMIYKQTSVVNYMIHSFHYAPPAERVFKIVYSCVDGKWNKSEPIYGRIIPAQNEYFEFDE
jgi:hypothetical protein